MNIFIFTIFCSLFSFGYLQETNNADYNYFQPEANKNLEHYLPLHVAQTRQDNVYGQTGRSFDPKPCSRRSNSESDPTGQQLNHAAKSLHDVTATLKPHALKTDKYDQKATDQQVPVLSPPPTVDELPKSRNSVSISNPVIDSSEKSHREVLAPINNEIHEVHQKLSNQRLSNSEEPSASTSEVKPASKSLSSNTAGFFGNEPNILEPENQYISEPGNVIPSELGDFRPTQINKPSTANYEHFSEFKGNFDPTQTYTLRSDLISKLRSKTDEVVSAATNKCSDDQDPNDITGHSRRSMSSHNDEDDGNIPYIESQTENDNAMVSVLNAEKMVSKTSNDQNLRTLKKSKSPNHENPVTHVERSQFKDGRRELIEPTKGAGIISMAQTPLLMQSDRICYACSTANNPSCWAPDRRTTVKYCRKGNNACVTKTFGKGSTFTLIRDCGKSCDDSDVEGIIPRYKSCSMCHSELCNGAYSINGHSIILALILIAIIKYLN